MGKEICLASVFAALVLSVACASGAVYYTYLLTTFSTTITGPTVVTVSGRQLLVSGSPFAAKGVAYSPTSPGNGPDFYWWTDSGAYENDFENLRSMGANTIRTYNAGIVYFNDAYYWVYHDDGTPPDSDFYTWTDGGSFEETYEITPPELSKSYKTTCTGTYAGWGVFLPRKVEDNSGKNNDGTVNGGVTENSGRIYRALGFNGTNAYISVENNASLNPDNITVEAWVYLVEPPASGTQQAIISKWDWIDDWNSAGYQLYLENDGTNFKICFAIGVPGTSYLTYSTTFSQGWHHIVGTFDGSTQIIYYDGVQENSVDWSGDIDPADNLDLNIGRKAETGDSYFKGILDEVRIENQAISSTEVSYRYNSGAGRYLGPNENTVLLFHFDMPIYINLSGSQGLKFWVKTPENLKVEIEAPKGNTQTKYISQFGWDGTENWQEITIPAENWTNLANVYCPFKITIETSGTFYVDKVRWTGFSAHSDGGIPSGTGIETWGSGAFEARYTGLDNVPEGKRCFHTSSSGSYAGWGIFLNRPHDHSMNLSGTTGLKFWVKTPENLKVEIEAPKGNTQTKYISQFGWDGTENWQEITIPAENWTNLANVYCPFKITIETNKTFYVDFVRWENVTPPPQTAILENRGILDSAWSQHLYVVMGFWVDRSVDFSKNWVRENLKSAFTQLVNRWKDHPAVLMWAFGNEVDIYAGRKENWFSLVQEAAQAAKQVDNNHPIMTVNQDITRIGNENIGSHDDNLENLDIWGANVYYGSSFGTLFDDYKNKSTKPFFLAEWGCDALDARDNTENENMQAEYLDNLWTEISENLSSENEEHVCIGGTLFEWSDEWWKAGNYDLHDNLATWASSYYYDYQAGANNMNEEWWGIMKFTSLQNPVKTPRQAYYTLKTKWTQ